MQSYSGQQRALVSRRDTPTVRTAGTDPTAAQTTAKTQVCNQLHFCKCNWKSPVLRDSVAPTAGLLIPVICLLSSCQPCPSMSTLNRMHALLSISDVFTGGWSYPHSLQSQHLVRGLLHPSSTLCSTDLTAVFLTSFLHLSTLGFQRSYN